MEAKFTNLVWDIDGTLINTNGVAARTLVDAINVTTGLKVDIVSGQFSGMTDYEIVLHLVKIKASNHNLILVNQILNEYSRNLSRALSENNPTVLGDVINSLKQLSNKKLIRNYIGTGNCINGAKTKLQASGIYGYFKNNQIFCATEKLITRNSIIEGVAKSLNTKNTLIIGDSPNDILAAKNSNFPVLAIPTGHHSLSQLAEYNPDYLLDSNWRTSDLDNILFS